MPKLQYVVLGDHSFHLSLNSKFESMHTELLFLIIFRFT